MWPSPGRQAAGSTPGQVFGWGLFTSVLAAVLTALGGGGLERAAMLGGLGLAATSALWLAARFGDPPVVQARRDDPPQPQ